MKHPRNKQIVLSDRLMLDLVLVDSGKYLMGDQEEHCKPLHEVSINSFYLSKFLVTQEVFKLIMGYNPAFFKANSKPVESVSWIDAHIFIQKLNEETNNVFRLPSEAEWEYAARGGKVSMDYKYSGSDNPKQVSWYIDNSKDSTKEIGLLLANELGLYDMSGNVSEWCIDDWHIDYRNAPQNGSPWIDFPKRGVERVVRGGSYIYDYQPCYSTYRLSFKPQYKGSDIGFRLVLPLE